MKTTIMKLINIIRVAFFFIGLLIFFSTNQFFNGCKKKKVITTTSVSNGEMLSPILDEDLTAAYHRHITRLENEKADLQQQIATTKSQLVIAKKNNLSLRGQLEDHIITASLLTDTTERLMNCDSISKSATEFIQASIEKDSLYEIITTTMQTSIRNGDSTIALQQQQYGLMQLDYNRANLANKYLVDENLLQHKELRKQKVKNKVLSVGLLLVSGTAASLLLLH